MPVLHVLYLPSISPTVSFRPYNASFAGFRLLDHAVDRLCAIRGSAPLIVLYHDEADAAATEDWPPRDGVFAFRTYQHDRVKALAELALAFPASTLVTWRVEAALGGLDWIEAALHAHQAQASHYTSIRGRPGAEIFEAAPLGALFPLELPYDTEPGRVLVELANLREPGKLRILTLDGHADPGSPASCVPPRLGTLADAWNVVRTLKPDSPEPAWTAPAAPPRDGRCRVLFVSPAGGFSGAEESLCLMVAALDRERFDPHAVVGFEGLFSRKLAAGGACVHTPNIEWMERTAWNLEFALRTLRTVDPDIVHANTHPGVAFLDAAGQLGIPVVQQVRVVELDALWEPICRATKVVAISNHVRALLLQRGVPENRIEAVPIGVDTGQFYPGCADGQAWRLAFDISPCRFVALMIARFVPSKRHDLLIAAAAGLPGVHVVLVGEKGDAAYRVRLREQIARAGMESRVTWLGFQPDVRPVLAAADALVLPSEAEALGRCVLEAMACGLPVIAGDGGGQVELVTHGATGLVFRAGDAEQLSQQLAQLIDDPGGRRRMGELAALRAGDFQPRVGAERMEQIFLSCHRRSH